MLVPATSHYADRLTEKMHRHHLHESVWPFSRFCGRASRESPPGYWTKDDEENADLIVRGDYRAVGKKLLQTK